MSDRHRSQDGRSETEEILGQAPETLDAPDQQGTRGGALQRKVGTRDERKRLHETPASVTRALAQDRTGSGDKEKV